MFEHETVPCGKTLFQRNQVIVTIDLRLTMAKAAFPLFNSFPLNRAYGVVVSHKLTGIYMGFLILGIML